MYAVEQCEEVACARLFSVMRCSAAFALMGQRPGVIRCPHCGSVKPGLANRVYVPSVLPPIFEDWHQVVPR